MINTAHYHIEVYQVVVIRHGMSSYLVDGHHFCGDALFSGGCGRVFSREILLKCFNLCSVLTNYQMKPWFARLMNIRWNLDCETVLTDKNAVENQRVLVERYRAEGKPSLPTTIGLEKQINPFLQAKI